MNPSIAMLNIGSEVLRGTTVNTNAAEAALILGEYNYFLETVHVVHDEETTILTALDQLLMTHDVVICTGGLGPTRDDLTKKVLARYFGSEKMVLHEPTFNQLSAWMKSRGREMTEKMKEQALVPDIAEVIANETGTAPGMVFRKGGKIIFSLPGVPAEMRWLMREGVVKIISGQFGGTPKLLRVLKLFGLPESDLAQKVEALGDRVSEKVQIAYLPHDGEVKMEMRALPEFEKQLDMTCEAIVSVVEPYIFTRDQKSLEQVLGEALMNAGLSVACAESCTGGAAAALITSVSGSSRYFKGSAVTYSVESKTNLLGISSELFAMHGVVSAEVATAMAERARQVFAADIGIGVTGAAEALPGDPDYSRAEICFAIADASGVLTRSLPFPQDRKSNIRRAAMTALFLCLKQVSEKKK